MTQDGGLLERLHNTLRQGAKSPVGRRFAVLTILCSSIVALFMTGLQLFLEYRRDRNEIFESVAIIERTVLPVLAESLWLFDEVLIESQLEGAVHVKGVRFAELRDNGDAAWSAGLRKTGWVQDYEMNVSRASGQDALSLGQLVVQVDFQQVYERALQRAGVILLTNGIKTAAVAGCILMIYYLTIGKQLVRIARYAQTLKPGHQPTGFSFDTLQEQTNEKGELADELVLVANAINRAAEASYNYSCELDESNRKLQEANREQAEFTYAISHDLKSPSNTIGMLIGEFEQMELEHPEAQQLLADMKHTNKRMGQLVEDVLNYARIIEERPAHEPVDLDALLQDLIKDLAAEVAASDAKVSIDPLPSVHGHAVQLRILFQNLLSNAIKFRSPDRSPKVQVRTVPPQNSDRSGQVRIEVSDNGIGIPLEHREKVFGLFQRLHSRSSYAGSGLGLTICRRVASNHRGGISIKNGRESGTAIEVLLWLHEPPGEAPLLQD